MVPSPGLQYITRALPRTVLPFTITYFSLTFAQSNDLIAFKIPPWLTLLIALLCGSGFSLGPIIYSRWASAKTAANSGAVIAPYVQQSPYSIQKELTRMMDGYPSEAFLRWTEKYGNVVQVDLVTSNMLVTNEPEHVKAILATQFNSFGKGPLVIEKNQSLLGTGIFNVNGDMWKFHRGITRPFFSRERISDFEIYDRNCEISLNSAAKRLKEGHSVDVQVRALGRTLLSKQHVDWEVKDLFGRFTLDSATEFLFGQGVESLFAELPYSPSFAWKNTAAHHNHPSNVFVNAFTGGLDIAEGRSKKGAEWPLWEFTKDKVVPLRQIMDEFTRPLMEKALADRERQLAGRVDLNENQQESVLSHLVTQTQDPQVIKDELINLLVAGRDTTMCLLTFSVYMLTQHPEIETRLRQEIFDIVGPTGAPDYSQIREMRYMRAFLNEVLRLYPPVPSDARTAFEDVVLPTSDANKKPVFVAKGTNCVYSIMNIHRRTELWGKDALEFDPDRFIDSRLKEYLTPNPYIFIPFNAGPRICLGQQFAYHEASYYMTRLLQKFTGFTLDEAANTPPPADWAFGDGRKPIERIHPMVHLTLYIKGGLWITMKDTDTNVGEA